MRGSAIAPILASRALSEGAGFAAVAAVLHAVTLGRDPVPLLPSALGAAGIALVLVAVLRERGTVGQSAGLVAVVIAGSAAWGLTLAARPGDALAVITRLIGFGILGEIWLWRVLGVARGLQRWRDVRDDALLALGAVVVAALLPGPVDRDALPVLGLVVALAGAVGLSLARSSEELALSGGQLRGRPAPSAAAGTAFALGLLAIGVAFALPTAQQALAAATRAIGPVLGQALFYLLVPLGYLAAYLVYLFQWLREVIRPSGLEFKLPEPPFAPGEEAARLRDLEASRPFILGALELLVALVAVASAVALVARLVQERRALLPEGASVEREGVEGLSLGATLRALFPRGVERPRPPADDGSRAAAVRRLYWRLLEVAEREGPGRRAPSETPAEHEGRLVREAARWRGASVVVRAFEDVRYGEREPDEAALSRARDALRAVESAP